MKGIKYLTVLFLLGQSSFLVQACSCWGPDKFLESVQELILQVEVLGVEALDKNDKYSYTVTTLRIDKAIKGKYEGDTIFVLNDKGFECFHGLPNNDVGLKYIITGEIINQFNMMSHRPDTLEGRIMIMDLCLENILHVDGNRVKGNISKNRSNKYTFYGRVLFRINKSWYEGYSRKRTSSPRKERLMQSMSIAKLEKKLKKKGLV